MTHAEFKIGGHFRCGGRRWRCTDIGSRVVVAICVELPRDVVQFHAWPTGEWAETIPTDDPSWFNGPPYAVAEHVFDEYGIDGCEPEP